MDLTNLVILILALCWVSYLYGHLQGWKQAMKNVQDAADEGRLRPRS